MTHTTPDSTRYAIPLGLLLAALAAIGFSGKAILVKLAYVDAVDPVTLLALRMLFSLPFFVAAACWRRSGADTRPLAVRDYGIVLILGLVGYYLSSLLDFMGLQYISAGLERLILFLYPTLVVLLSAAFLRRPVGPREGIALLLSYGGIALVFLHDLAQPGGGDGLALGAALVFASTLTYAAYLVGVGAVVARLGAIRLTAYAMLVASAAILLQFALTHPWSALATLPGRVYALALAMALFSTVLPVFMLSASIRLIGAGHTALIGSIGPVSTILLAWLFLGEAVSVRQILGAALVLAGVLVISLWRR
ncbi:MAG: DMT family transporter [Gammaproteobacteria bacterium]|nr:DMT family transporter [Gammaproteobacteria bacterium]